jgi:hypothetical protein
LPLLRRRSSSNSIIIIQGPDGAQYLQLNVLDQLRLMTIRQSQLLPAALLAAAAAAAAPVILCHHQGMSSPAMCRHMCRRLLLLLLLLHISPVNIHLLSFWKPTVVTLPWCPS